MSEPRTIITALKQTLDHLLRLPNLKDCADGDFDTASTTLLQKEIYRRKRILHFLYDEYCRPCIESANRATDDATILEIGSGTSPLSTKVAGLMESDVIALPWLTLVCSAYALPFSESSLDRIFLLFVVHHMREVEAFLDEAKRCLKPGGEMVIVDPAITFFSWFYYKFHADKMDLRSEKWGLECEGRLTGSNIALSWMVFFRDRKRFASRYPEFIIEKIEYNTCMAFMLSGGLRIRQLLPTSILKGLFKAENWLIKHVTRQLAVTMAITLRRI